MGEKKRVNFEGFVAARGIGGVWKGAVCESESWFAPKTSQILDANRLGFCFIYKQKLMNFLL